MIWELKVLKLRSFDQTSIITITSAVLMNMYKSTVQHFTCGPKTELLDLFSGMMTVRFFLLNSFPVKQ